MINIKTSTYDAYLMTASGIQFKLSQIAESIEWEENDGELAQRAIIDMADIKIKGQYVSTMAKLGAFIIIKAGDGKLDEVFKGRIYDHDSKDSGKETITLVAYDNLYPTQKSRDNQMYKSGTSGKAILHDIFKTWNIPIGSIDGPNVALGKKTYQNDYIADMILDVLKDGKRLGGGRYIPRSSAGKISIIERGSNKTVYHFDEDENLVSTSDKNSISDIVTRVKIIGKRTVDVDIMSKKHKKVPVVEGQVDGKTEFGVFQEIYNRNQDESIAAAKKAAKDILDDRGKPKRTTSLQAPDVPSIRKGDKIHVSARKLSGYFYILSVHHDATTKTMTMEVEP